MTETGLTPLNLSKLNTFQQVQLLVHVIIGSPVLVSWLVVMFRKHAFEKRFAKVIAEDQERRSLRICEAAANAPLQLINSLSIQSFRSIRPTGKVDHCTSGELTPQHRRLDVPQL
jgi:hypothetical protein